jgi:hypothetical protein
MGLFDGTANGMGDMVGVSVIVGVGVVVPSTLPLLVSDTLRPMVRAATTMTTTAGTIPHFLALPSRPLSYFEVTMSAYTTSPISS